MTREEKLTRIYEVIADKTLSFGCLVKIKDDRYIQRITRVYDNGVIRTENDLLEPMTGYDNEFVETIIGHPVMIGDVLDWIEKNKFISIEDKIQFVGFDTGNQDSTIYWYYKFIGLFGRNKRKPIDDQSDECIDFILSLIQ